MKTASWPGVPVKKILQRWPLQLRHTALLSWGRDAGVQDPVLQDREEGSRKTAEGLSELLSSKSGAEGEGGVWLAVLENSTLFGLGPRDFPFPSGVVDGTISYPHPQPLHSPCFPDVFPWRRRWCALALPSPLPTTLHLTLLCLSDLPTFLVSEPTRLVWVNMV